MAILIPNIDAVINKTYSGSNIKIIVSDEVEEEVIKDVEVLDVRDDEIKRLK